jgi:sulfur relay protein TusB/DsrH
MLVLVKSGPETNEGKSALKLARDMSADVVLLQNGVYFALNELLEGFCGTVYALKEDMVLRGLGEHDVAKGLKDMNWDELIDAMAEEEKVVGIF